MGRKKSTDSTQILFVCVVGMIAIFGGLILFGMIQSYLTPDVSIGEAQIQNIIKTERSDKYEVAFSVKNGEKKNVKVEIKTSMGFDVYRMRHSTSPKPNFYRVFQMLKESMQEVVLPPKVEREIRTTIEIEHGTFKRFEINQETKIYPRVTAEKVLWADSPEE